MSNELEVKEEKAINPFQPRNLEEAFKLAKMMAESDLVPKDFKGKPANCFIAMTMGSELGIGAMQAVQNIAVINGRPSIWGDLGLALVKIHPEFVSITESMDGTGDARKAVCLLKRRNQPDVTGEFSVSDAKTAKLWAKDIWTSYPARMLKMRARWFAMRDQFPDALKGIQSAEESSDIITVEAEPAPAPYREPKTKPTPEAKKADPKQDAPISEAPPVSDRVTPEELFAIKAHWKKIYDILGEEAGPKGAAGLKRQFGFSRFEEVRSEQMTDLIIAMNELVEVPNAEPGSNG